MAVAVIMVMAACNNKENKGDENKAEEKKEETKPVAAAKPAPLGPYKAVLVEHTVKDYDAWYKVFKASDSIPKAYGLSDPSVGRGLDNDKDVFVYTMAADIQKAREFAKSPALKAAMAKSGVTSKPTISYLDVLWDDTSSIPQHERLMVVHHVKDYDTWKKAFDAEGDSARATNGIVLRALARGVDDAKTVTILFAVTDMAKAKARVGSPDLKKIMTDAGVDGPPTITWFKWANN